ncbi:hypothetical protein F3J11_36175 [Burkholderia sp. Cy-647]|nr:class II D-tagatose-bisphosphate aldolase, non-catalytic subunit [Burkholderia sp. Cy-647]NIF68042.1 hypothetical protein [Burkholderia sp. Cy-647]
MSSLSPAAPQAAVAPDTLGAIFAANRKGARRGIYSVCSAHALVLEAAFEAARDDGSPLLRTGRGRRVAISVQHYHLAPLVLEATDHVCALPERFLLRFADRLDLLPLPVEVAGFGLSAAWHPRNEANAAHRWLREQLFASVGLEPEADG